MNIETACRVTLAYNRLLTSHVVQSTITTHTHTHKVTNGEESNDWNSFGTKLK